MSNRIDAIAHARWSPLSSRAWSAYFRRNARSLLRIPWNRGAELAECERRLIAKSVQQFQLGERGQGSHFLKVAERHACCSCESDDVDYIAALKLFIAEEQRHARDLGRFLDLAGIAQIQRQWTNDYFRCFRKLAGLQSIISVLLVAEVIAMVYYAALRKATRSRVLKRLCEQILRDEAMHIRFQSQRLAKLRRDQSRFRFVILAGLQWILFCGTCLVVWLFHSRVFRAGGLTFSRFWKHAHSEFQISVRLMDSAEYEFLAQRIAKRARCVSA